jgi:hypothetical protein
MPPSQQLPLHPPPLLLLPSLLKLQRLLLLPLPHLLLPLLLLPSLPTLPRLPHLPLPLQLLPSPLKLQRLLLLLPQHLPLPSLPMLPRLLLLPLPLLLRQTRSKPDTRSFDVETPACTCRGFFVSISRHRACNTGPCVSKSSDQLRRLFQRSCQRSGPGTRIPRARSAPFAEL